MCLLPREHRLKGFSPAVLLLQLVALRQGLLAPYPLPSDCLEAAQAVELRCKQERAAALPLGAC